MCPMCRGQMQSIVMADTDSASVQWCTTCSYMGPAPQASCQPGIMTIHLVVPDDPKAKRRWEWFQSLKKDPVVGWSIQDTEWATRHWPRQWLPTFVAMTFWQRVRTFLGRRVANLEPRLAMRYDPDTLTIDLAFADQVVPAKQLRMKFWDMFNPRPYWD